MKKKKLYYTVEKETEFINEQQELVGKKWISVYKINRNNPILWFELDLEYEESTIDEINNHIDRMDLDSNNFELVLL